MTALPPRFAGVWSCGCGRWAGHDAARMQRACEGAQYWWLGWAKQAEAAEQPCLDGLGRLLLLCHLVVRRAASPYQAAREVPTGNEA